MVNKVTDYQRRLIREKIMEVIDSLKVKQVIRTDQIVDYVLAHKDVKNNTELEHHNLHVYIFASIGSIVSKSNNLEILPYRAISEPYYPETLNRGVVPSDYKMIVKKS